MVSDSVATLTARVSLDCWLVCDGEQLIQLKAGQIKKISVPLGEHLLQFVSIENPCMRLQKKMDFAMAGRNYLLLIDDMQGEMEQEEISRSNAEQKEKSRRREEEEARARLEQEARMRAEAEAKYKAEAEDRMCRAEAEARAHAEEEARKMAEAEAKARSEVEARTPKRATIRIQSAKINGLEARYEGFVLNGKPEGHGIAYYDNGHIYEGDWQDGKKSGRGTYTWPDESRYEGQWVADDMSGLGTYYYPNGNRFEGEFKKGIFNGNGVLIYPNGNRYSGSWTDGQPDKHYRFYFKDGRYYDGDSWYGSLDNGGFDGIVTNQNGERLFYDQGRLAYYIKNDGLHFKSKEVLVVVKYQDHDLSGLYTKVIGVYYDIDEGIKAGNSESCWNQEHILFERVSIGGHCFPSSDCYVAIKSFFNSTRPPQILALTADRNSAVSVIETQSGERMSWDEVKDFHQRKCGWKLFEKRICSFPIMH